MAFLFGAVFGGFVVTYLVGSLVGKLFTNLRPVERASLASLVGFLACAFIAGFGFSDGRQFAFGASFYYIPGAVLAFLALRRHYLKDWIEDDRYQ